VIYYACSYVPLEILLASKLPFAKIDSVDYTEDPLVHRNLCGYCKTTFESLKAMNDKDLFIAVDSCDAMRRINDLARDFSKARIIQLRLPWKRDDESKNFYRDQLANLLEVLSLVRGSSITLEELKEGIKRFNDLKDYLWQLHREIQKAIDFANSGKRYQPSLKYIRKGVPRLAVVGGIIKDRKFLKMIEDIGAELVLNETCGGMRGFTGEAFSASDPLYEIATRLIQRRVPHFPIAENPPVSEARRSDKVESKVLRFFRRLSCPERNSLYIAGDRFPIELPRAVVHENRCFCRKAQKRNSRGNQQEIQRKVFSWCGFGFNNN